MTAFTIVWFGQVISLFGSAMTRFALTIWAWELTGEATALALVGFASFAPEVILSPVAGALVDRWNRKLVMMVSDLAAGLATVALVVLYANDLLQVWHLWVAGAFTGAFASFQWPAYSAAISLMIPKEQYTRASGMMSLAESGSGVLAPLTAGMLIGWLGTQPGFNGIALIMTIDVATFVFAVLALLIIHVPAPTTTAEGRGSLWHEMLYGFRYILARPSLLGLQLIFFFGNFSTTVAFTLLAPMILARTGNNSALLGSVNAVGAVGAIIGGSALSVWGGPKRRTYGLFISWFLVGICQVLFGFGLPFWFIGSFVADVISPTLNGCNQAIWQSKVAPDVQGRVFAVRRTIAQITIPLAMLLAGWLADKIFEPAMMPTGALAPLFGSWVGTGPGAGMALIYIFTGLITVLVGIVPFAIPVVREAETRLPDHVQA